jgi:enoyl-CoA hydratase
MTDVEHAVDTLAPVNGLSVSLAHGVLSVTIDRPDSLNSLTIAVLRGITDAMEAAGADSRVKVVRIGGSGRGFSSGATIGADALEGGSGADMIRVANRVIRNITALRHPVVAVVQGAAAGVGASLALACDIIVASDNAAFILAFTKIALMPDGGASALIAAAVGRVRAMRMALMAERISATEAFEWGLVTAVYPAASFIEEVDKVVESLSAGPAVALGRTKQTINGATLTELEAAFEREYSGQCELMHAPDFREGAKAFLQRRTPRFTDV